MDMDIVRKETGGKGGGMQVVPVEMVRSMAPDTVLAHPIYDYEHPVYVSGENGGDVLEPLFPAGTGVVDPRTAAMLEAAGIEYVITTSRENFLRMRESGSGNTLLGIPLGEELDKDIADHLLTDFCHHAAEAAAGRGFSKEAVDGMTSHLVGLAQNVIRYGNVISQLHMLEKFDLYTYRHSLEVMMTGLLIAKQACKMAAAARAAGDTSDFARNTPELTPELMLNLALGFFFHDIGKTVIGRTDSDERVRIGHAKYLLKKPGPLDEKEFEYMKQHVKLGVLTLCIDRRDKGGPKSIVNSLEERFGSSFDKNIFFGMIGFHHDRFDEGKYSYKYAPDGYPQSVKEMGPVTRFAVRVIGLADAMNAMSTKRSYRDAMHPTEVLAEVAKCSGTQFDPDVARCALTVLVPYPERSFVVTNGGIVGLVVGCDAPEKKLEFIACGSLTKKGEVFRGSPVQGERFSASNDSIAFGANRADSLAEAFEKYVKKTMESGRNSPLVNTLMRETSLVAEPESFDGIRKEQTASGFFENVCSRVMKKFPDARRVSEMFSSDGRIEEVERVMREKMKYIERLGHMVKEGVSRGEPSSPPAGIPPGDRGDAGIAGAEFCL